MEHSEEEVLASAVQLILDGRAEEAIQLVSNYYGVRPPRLRVGLPKKCYKALGCYVPAKKTIYVRSSREYMDPFVIMHELYHHLRYRMGRHRGTERGADEFALEAIRAWTRLRGGGKTGTGG